MTAWRQASLTLPSSWANWSTERRWRATLVVGSLSARRAAFPFITPTGTAGRVALLLLLLLISSVLQGSLPRLPRSVRQDCLSTHHGMWQINEWSLNLPGPSSRHGPDPF